MIISRKKEFAFIHVPKTAGTSITEALSPYDDRSIIETLLNFKPLNAFPFFYSLNPLPQHIRANKLRDYLSQPIFQKLYTFAFVRNPWDWQVSLFHYLRESIFHPKYSTVCNMDFQQFLQWRIQSYKITQNEFITNRQGNIIVDFVGRFEHLEQDFRRICRKIGVPFNLPHKNKSRHRNYRKYYTEKTKNLVVRYFKQDIELFDYEF